MAWGDVEDAEFQAWADRVKAKIETEELKQQVLKSARKIRRFGMDTVKGHTPEGQYPAGSGKSGGHLRRTWHFSQPAFSGMVISMELYNNTEYASYVEDGHRTRTPHTPESIRRSKGVHWVPGSHMLMKTLFELNAQMPQLLSPVLKEALGGMFD